MKTPNHEKVFELSLFAQSRSSELISSIDHLTAVLRRIDSIKILNPVVLCVLFGGSMVLVHQMSSPIVMLSISPIVGITLFFLWKFISFVCDKQEGKAKEKRVSEIDSLRWTHEYLFMEMAPFVRDTLIINSYFIADCIDEIELAVERKFDFANFFEEKNGNIAYPLTKRVLFDQNLPSFTYMGDFGDRKEIRYRLHSIEVAESLIVVYLIDSLGHETTIVVEKWLLLMHLIPTGNSLAWKGDYLVFGIILAFFLEIL